MSNSKITISTNINSIFPIRSPNLRADFRQILARNLVDPSSGLVTDYLRRRLSPVELHLLSELSCLDLNFYGQDTKPFYLIVLDTSFVVGTDSSKYCNSLYSSHSSKDFS